MVEYMEVTLKNPRGSIKHARVLYEVMDEGGFRAWIYIGRGKVNYAEMQTVVSGAPSIRSFFEYDDNPDVSPTYIDNGYIRHRISICSLFDWESWLKKYVSGLDPRDHFRFYSEAVGGF